MSPPSNLGHWQGLDVEVSNLRELVEDLGEQALGLGGLGQLFKVTVSIVCVWIIIKIFVPQDLLIVK